MGKTYIKEENGQKVLYEENTSPFPFGDKKLGELHENWDGSLETRNSFSENYELQEERNELEEIVTCIVPGTKPHDYDVKTSGGGSGTLKWNSWKERHELENNPTKHYSGSGSSYGGSPYSSGSSKSNGWGRSIAFGIFAVLVGMSLGLIEDYKKNPSRYASFYQVPVVQSQGIVNNYNGYYTKRVHRKTKKQLPKYEKILNESSEFQLLQKYITKIKVDLYNDKMAKIAEIREDENSDVVVPEVDIYTYVEALESQYKIYLDNMKTKINSTVNDLSEKERRTLIELIDSDEISSDSIYLDPEFWEKQYNESVYITVH